MVRATLFTTATNQKPPKCQSTGEWINRTGYIHNAILFCNKKERRTDTFCSVEEPWKHDAKAKMPGIVIPHIMCFIYIKCPEKACKEGEWISEWLARTTDGNREWMQIGIRLPWLSPRGVQASPDPTNKEHGSLRKVHMLGLGARRSVLALNKWIF